MILRTRTLLSIIITTLSIITAVSNYCKRSGTTQACDGSESAYQEVVKVLLELLTTLRYVSGISIGV